MDDLPLPLLEVIPLCDVEEMKYKEIGSMLEIPIGHLQLHATPARNASEVRKRL